MGRPRRAPHLRPDPAHMVIVFTEDDGEGEVEARLPAKWAICDNCEGAGYHLTPSIREHGYSPEEFEEAFFEEEDRAEYFKRGGAYDVPCEDCGGTGKVLVVERERVHPVTLSRLDRMDEEWAQSEAERLHEDRMGY